MLISARMQRKYPKLSKWLWDNICLVQNKPKVLNAFIKYSELGSVGAASILGKCSKPVIDFKVMDDYGLFMRNKFPDTVFISKKLCRKFEKSEVDAKNPKMHQLIEATILHEMVHWGDHQDGKDQLGEEGEAFEREAYGKVIFQYW